MTSTMTKRLKAVLSLLSKGGSYRIQEERETGGEKQPKNYLGVSGVSDEFCPSRGEGVRKVHRGKKSS